MRHAVLQLYYKTGLLLQKFVNLLGLVANHSFYILMTTAVSFLRKSTTSLLVLTGVVLAIGSSGAPSVSIDSSSDISAGSSISVAAAGDWQRPAPVTWSSRAQTRWSARFVTSPKYAV